MCKTLNSIPRITEANMKFHLTVGHLQPSAATGIKFATAVFHLQFSAGGSRGSAASRKDLVTGRCDQEGEEVPRLSQDPSLSNIKW